MAKTPSAKVSKTSGQGVSRYSYQRTYGMTHKTGIRLPAFDAPAQVDITGGRDRYAKTKPAGGYGTYGETAGILTGLEDVKKFGTEKPVKAVASPRRERARKLK